MHWGRESHLNTTLFAVLELITELSTSAGVTLESLEHVPLEANSSSASGVIPLSFILTGDGTVYSLILQLQELLPTLQITELLLVYIGDGQFQVMVDADLRVLILGRASASHWQRPAQTPLELVNLPNLGFGVPFEILAQFLQA